MKSSVHPSLRAGLVLVFTAVSLFASLSAQAASSVVLQFTSTGVNTSGNVMTLNSPHLNGKPGLNLIVTQDVSLAAVVVNDHPIGVFYNGATKEWNIFNEDVVAIPVGAIFDVLIPAVAKRVDGGATNSFFNQTIFPLRKGNPNALLLQTHVFDPFPSITNGALNGVFQVSPVGLYFNPVITTKPIPASSGCWAVFNESVAPAVATAYTVADVTTEGVRGTPYSFIFTTTAANIGKDLALISNPATNGKPNAVVFANHISTAAVPVFDEVYAVVYYVPNSSWGIITEDGSNMPVGVSFVVTAYPSVTGT